MREQVRRRRGGRGVSTDEDGVDVVFLADFAGLAARALLLSLGRLPLRLLLALPRLLLLLPHLSGLSSSPSSPLSDTSLL
jgi:hypothetical protein